MFIFLSPCRKYASLLFASHCWEHWALKASVSEPTKTIVELCSVCSCPRQQNNAIASYLLLMHLRVFARSCGMLRVFLRTFCLWSRAFRDEQTSSFVIQRTKVQYIFAITGTVVGPCLNGGAGEQKLCMYVCMYVIYIYYVYRMCAYVSKNCITRWHL